MARERGIGVMDVIIQATIALAIVGGLAITPLLYYNKMTLAVWTVYATAVLAILVPILYWQKHVWALQDAAHSHQHSGNTSAEMERAPEGPVQDLAGPVRPGPAVTTADDESTAARPPHGRKPKETDPADPNGNRFSNLHIIRSTDYSVEVEVSYFYNGSAGDDAYITFTILHSDGSPSSYGRSARLASIRSLAISRVIIEFQAVPELKPLGKTTQIEVCMSAKSETFHCQRFALVKDWKPKPHPPPSVPKPSAAEASQIGNENSEAGFQNKQDGGESLVLETTSEDPAKVFVVFGRNKKARKAMFDFLRAIGLKPIEFSSQAVSATGKGAPYVGEALDAAFSVARAVVVLLTPDDLACLREGLRESHEERYETEPTAQPRQNVLFEAGMAFGKHPDRTIVVELGKLRPFSDVSGRHVVKMNSSTERRQELADRLFGAGCAVDKSGTDWHTAGDFDGALEGL